MVVWNMMFLTIFHINWEFHHPNWRTPSFFRGVGIPPTSKLLGALFQDNPVLLFGMVWAAITIHDPQRNPKNPHGQYPHTFAGSDLNITTVLGIYGNPHIIDSVHHWISIYIYIYDVHMFQIYIYIYHLYVWYPRITKAEAFTAQSTDSFYAARGVRLQSLEMTRSSACANVVTLRKR